VQSGESSCRGVRPALDGCDPITSNLYDALQTGSTAACFRIGPIGEETRPAHHNQVHVIRNLSTERDLPHGRPTLRSLSRGCSFADELLIAPIGSWIPIIGIRIRIWIRESKPDEPETGAWEETVMNEETVTMKETTASKEAVMEAAIVKRETTTA
jgi:hypothetical protein